MVQPSLLEYQSTRVLQVSMKNEPVKKHSVLVIDDQKNWRELLSEILRDQFDVSTADTYTGALAAIQRQRPPYHVVVTDMRLEDGQPGNEDGLKLLEYLKQHGRGTKTILVTGYATVPTARKALAELDAFDYVEKYPSEGTRKFDFKQFKSTVRKAAEAADEIRLTQPALLNLTRYACLFIHSEGKPDEVLRDGTQLLTGETYTIRLSLQDHFLPGAESVLLAMPREPKEKILLDLFIFGEHLRVERGTETQWQFSGSLSDCNDFEFTIIPEFDGSKKLFVEINQNHTQVVRLSRTLVVAGTSSK